MAAVNAAVGEIYVNPLVGMTQNEWRFVMAHEMLHAALRHGERVGGRDPYLWNVAADLVINGWLLEMGVGTMPDGALHDPVLKGMSVEDGVRPDHHRPPPLPEAGDTARASAWATCSAIRCRIPARPRVRRAGRHLPTRTEHGPGLPRPGPRPLPPDWSRRSAHWTTHHWPGTRSWPAGSRSTSRPSRRPAPTPGRPDASPVRRTSRGRAGSGPVELERLPTYGVVLDTSGSMDRELLGKALGAIASYSRARDVPAARVVYCDAAAYDAGYVPVDDIAGRVQVRGRGGTVLQPGVDLLERADDFPRGRTDPAHH